MKLISKLIENAMEKELEETAITSDEAIEKNLALLTFNTGIGPEIILYTLEGNIEIFGYMSISKLENTNDSYVVDLSAAEKGFGPLLYEIAMSKFGLIVPDRFSVSQKAKNLWFKFYNRNDIIKEHLPKTVRMHNEDFLNYGYTTKNPVNSSRLEQKNKLNLSKAYLYNKTEEGLTDKISELGLTFFTKKNNENK
jgi:hypothetical protein